MRAHDQSLWTVLGGVHMLTRKGREHAYVRGAGLCWPGIPEGPGERLRLLATIGRVALADAEEWEIRVLREERMIYPSGMLTDKGREAHASGLRHEERLLAEIEDAHPIGDDGKPYARVRTLRYIDPINPEFSMETSNPEAAMLAPYVYRETCASVAVSGELGAYDARVSWQRDRHGTRAL